MGTSTLGLAHADASGRRKLELRSRRPNIFFGVDTAVKNEDQRLRMGDSASEVESLYLSGRQVRLHLRRPMQYSVLRLPSFDLRAPLENGPFTRTPKPPPPVLDRNFVTHFRLITLHKDRSEDRMARSTDPLIAENVRAEMDSPGND